MPGVFEELFSDEEIRKRIGAVSVSEKTTSGGRILYAGIYCRNRLWPGTGSFTSYTLLSVFHQEGHIEAIRFYSPLRDVTPLICFHFSGGTTEALLLEEDKLTIVGGSRDLAYGQVLDRIGVALGLDFPCGDAMDKIAVRSAGHPSIFTPIKVKDGYVNLSGIETQGQNALGKYPQMQLIDDLFDKLSRSIMEMTLQLSYNMNQRFYLCRRRILQRYMRAYLAEHLYKDLNIVFGKNELSSDNAIGVALLGGKRLWR